LAGHRTPAGECSHSEVGDNVVDASVVGRLPRCLPFWRDTLKANQFVLDIIEHGYTIPFMEEPPPAYAANNRSALNYPVFVREAIHKLILSNVVREVDSPTYCCNPLTVATGKKLRLVLDLSRFVNPYVRHVHFKYADWSVAEQVVQPGSWFFNWDFTSGYHHIAINPIQYKYLGFAFNWPGIGQRFFEFLQLPFGLNSACYVFTKLTRPLIKYWRSQALNVFIYIDDGLCVCRERDHALKASAQVRLTIKRAGFVVNETKSSWVPSRRVQWLGFTVDSEVCRYYVSQDKLEVFKAVLEKLLGAEGSVTARGLAKFVGRAVSVERALGPIVRLMSRSSARLCAMAPHWEARVQLDELVIREMRFLRERSQYYNGQTIIRGSPDGALHCFSDASDTGYGAYAIEPSVLSVQGQWSLVESRRSSTWRELEAVRRSLVAFRYQVACQALQWHCDNAAVVRILEYGSNKPQLQLLAVQVAEVCFESRIRLFPVWIPRADNTVADRLSRGVVEVDCDDWQLHPRWFRYLDAIWGPHTVDRFADENNAQLSVFNSKRLCPGTSGVDAFAFSWADENNWLCPPIDLVLRVLEKVRADKATATLVVPWWESSYFWPTLRPTSGSWHDLVTHVRVIPADYRRGRYTSTSSAFNDSQSLCTLALRLAKS
jgi:hypothetical protein